MVRTRSVGRQWSLICEFISFDLSYRNCELHFSFFIILPIVLNCAVLANNFIRSRFSHIIFRKFDEALRSRNPSWGVRNLEEVTAIAKKEGLEMVQSVEMPANNLSVLFRKA